MIETNDVLTDDARSFLADLQRTFGARRRRAPRAPRGAARAAPRRRASRLPARDGRDPGRRLARGADARRDRRPARRDHGPGRPQDGDQRAQLGRTGVHGRLRGLELADLVQLHRRPAQPDRRARADDLARHRREAVRARRRSGGAVRAAARVAPGGAALRGRRRADVGVAVRLRALLLPQPRPQRPLLLPPEARVAPRGAPLERRLRLVAGPARRAAGNDQGDRPDRDDPGRVRDGRDPLRAARALGRAERRAAGTTSSA